MKIKEEQKKTEIMHTWLVDKGIFTWDVGYPSPFSVHTCAIGIHPLISPHLLLHVQHTWVSFQDLRENLSELSRLSPFWLSIKLNERTKIIKS
jgi:hypothetical protein